MKDDAARSTCQQIKPQDSFGSQILSIHALMFIGCNGALLATLLKAVVGSTAFEFTAFATL